MASISPAERLRRELESTLDGVGEEVEAVGRVGARLILQQALEDEVTEYLGRAPKRLRAGDGQDDLWLKSLYRGRGAVEREFGRLKHEWALLPLRVRGIEKVRLHADLTILAKLACALSRAQTMPLAA